MTIYKKNKKTINNSTLNKRYDICITREVNYKNNLKSIINIIEIISMKKFIAATALLLASSSAFAGLISHTDTFGTIGSNTDTFINGPFSETISLAGFDNALGTLTGVSINVEGQLTTGGYIQNQSTELARANYSVLIAQDWKVTTSAADNYTFSGVNFVTPLLSGASSASGFTLAAGELFNFYKSTQLFSSNLTNVDLLAFTTGSAVDFIFSTFALTNGQAFISSGVSEFIGKFSTAAYGKVTVNYTYDDVPVTAIPEPTSIALLALGLVGFGLRKKKLA